ALKENGDIESVSETIELQNYRTTVGDTDAGKAIKDEIEDLNALLAAYNNGVLKPRE
ncbi:MAG: fructose-bisphosphatase class III, partial [Selenomonadaceae bacterium]|nr:fructose-bisphosphatase class III [Selenomonadaceae bacterium]MBP3722966.1 fructose-bisphosphatase class III [Selenomonadaceae bacterium]